MRTLRDVGGSSLNQVPTYRVFGQAGEAYSTLEGVQTSSLQASSGQANYWDYTALEEASVKTLGNSAEVPSRGVNLVGDREIGRQRVPQQHVVQQDAGPDFQGDNIDDELRAQGIDRRLNAVEPLQRQQRSRRPDHQGQAVVLHRRPSADRRPAAAEHVHAGRQRRRSRKELAWFATAKVSYQMSQRNRLVGFYASQPQVRHEQLEPVHPVGSTAAA